MLAIATSLDTKTLYQLSDAGNTDEANVFRNTMLVLKKLKKNYPVYRGLDSTSTVKHAENIHYSGEDGLAEMKNREDKDVS